MTKQNTQYFINPLSDLFVKYLLGSVENNNLLLSFVNAVLEDHNHPSISKIEVQNPFNIPDIQSGKLSILDLKAQDEKKHWYNIEVQTTSSPSFVDRTTYYACRLFADQLSGSEIYQSLNPVIVINLLSFKLFEIHKAHSCFKLIEFENLDLVLQRKIEVHFIEIPKIHNLRDGKLKKWLEYFTHEGRDGQKMEELIKTDSEMAQAHEHYRRFTHDPHLRALWDSQERAERDRLTALYEAEYKKTIEIAKALLAKGSDFAFISEITGLSIEEIENLN